MPDAQPPIPPGSMPGPKSAERQLRDTTEQLARSEARIRAALDGARMICWDLDLVTNQWETTADLSDFFGLPRGVDYNNQPGSALSAVHPDDVPAVLAGRQRAIETGEPMRYEFRGRVAGPDGQPRWFATRGQVLRDAAGQALRLVAVTTDVSERKRSEAEREALNRQLQDAQRWESLGVLASGIAHDFNNILTVVLGSAGLARKLIPALNPAVPHLDQIEQAARRTADLCRQMLAYSGRGHVSQGKTDINQVVRDSAALLAIPVSKSAALRFDLADGLPQVSADAAPIRQVLVNLVVNAVESIGATAGEVTVTTQLVEIPSAMPAGYHLPPPPGRYVRLVVSDTGPGIPQNVQARMFDPFFTTKLAGRGLGLAAVLGIMRAHHGAVRASSEAGKKAVVETLWPVVVSSLSPISVAAISSRIGKALIVDDEIYVREVTASTVQEVGLEPLLAGDGAMALALYQQHRDEIRVAVLDMVMPGMSGDQLLRELRALAPGLPALLVSGFTNPGVIDGASAKNTEFVQKPFHPEELLAALRRVAGLG